MFSLNLHFIFLVLAMKIYLILCPIVQLLQFLIWDNRPSTLLAITNSSVWKYVSSGWYTAATDSWAHHTTSRWTNEHEQIMGASLPTWIKVCGSMQWKHPRLPSTKKFKVTSMPSDGKVMLTVFWNSQGVLLTYFWSVVKMWILHPTVKFC
jgi:hypothetical protein